MAGESTQSTLGELIQTEWINPLIQDYAVDAMSATGTCWDINVAGKGTKVVSFPRWVKDSSGVKTTTPEIAEPAAGVNTALDPVDTQVTALQYAFWRFLTDVAAETTILPRDMLVDIIARDAGTLLREAFENLVVSKYPSATTSVGTSGSDMSVANYLEAMAALDGNNARGTKVCVLDKQAASDLRAGVATSTGAQFAGGSGNEVIEDKGMGYVGRLFGVPIFVSTLTDTANAGADVVSAMYISGATPQYAALGSVTVHEAKMRTESKALELSEQYAFSQFKGVGLINANSMCKLVTDAP